MVRLEECMHIREMHRRGVSRKQIASLMRRDRKTVRKYLLSAPRDYRTLKTRPATLGRYQDKRGEAFEWMNSLQQGAIRLSLLEKQFGQVSELKRLLAVIRDGRLSQRKKVIAALATERGIRKSFVSSFLHLSRKSVLRYRRLFQEGSAAGLFKRATVRSKSQDDRIKQQVFALLHSPPHSFGVNRTSWKMADLQKVLRAQGQLLSRDLIRKIIHEAGYRWRTARVVLTSRDPEYQVKVDAIVRILSNLGEGETFCSIDEFGPFAIQERGGRKRVGPGERYTVPQRQKSKGSLIITAALELSCNQVTHFYSDKKNTHEMIKMMDLLRNRYRNCKTIYPSWDAASWHMSQEFFQQITQRNVRASADGYPIVKTAPLPAGAQFLNVIESVFSGMARAILHNSDYCSVGSVKESIDRYYAERNEFFREHPKRAGGKIWGQERVQSRFREGNNCKDPLYR
jgi:hypothetical protein